jgi:hypothetical protein
MDQASVADTSIPYISVVICMALNATSFTAEGNLATLSKGLLKVLRPTPAAICLPSLMMTTHSLLSPMTY